MTASVDLSQAPAGEEASARRAARGRVFELLRESQIGGRLTSAMVETLIAEAEQQGWSDVVLLGRYLAVFCARFVDHQAGSTEIAALYDDAIADGDEATVALALACRAQDPRTVDGRAPIDADRDLARAMVLLERFQQPSSTVVLAHIECAYACEERDLWELQLRHYEMAEPCLDWEEYGEAVPAGAALQPGRGRALLAGRAARGWPVRPSWPARAEAARRALAGDRRRARSRPRGVSPWASSAISSMRSSPATDGTEPADHSWRPRASSAGYVHLARAFRTVDAGTGPCPL